jgi:hypothetical protein
MTMPADFCRTRAKASSQVAKMEFDHSLLGGRHRPHPAIVFGWRLRIVPARHGSGDVNMRAKQGRICSAIRACPRQVNSTLSATPLRRATSVTFAPGAQRLFDDPRLVIPRPAPPPLQPAQHLDPHRLMS